MQVSQTVSQDFPDLKLTTGTESLSSSLIRPAFDHLVQVFKSLLVYSSYLYRVRERILLPSFVEVNCEKSDGLENLTKKEMSTDVH